jgi:hypothetical protein
MDDVHAFDGGRMGYFPMGNGVFVVDSNVIIANNTIAGNYANGILVADAYEVDIAPLDGASLEAHTATIVNNIVVDNGFIGITSPLDGSNMYYNIAYLPYVYDRAPEVPTYDFTITHNDVWSYSFPNNFSELLMAYDGTYGNISSDPLLEGPYAHLDQLSPCLNTGADAGRPEYGNVFYDFFLDFEMLGSPAPDGFPALDGDKYLIDDTLVHRPQSGVYDIGAQEMEAVEFSIVTYAPVVATGLFQANQLWTNVLSLLGGLSPEVQAQVDELLVMVQQNIEGAMGLTNPIAASGALQRAMALLQQIEALLA